MIHFQVGKELPSVLFKRTSYTAKKKVDQTPAETVPKFLLDAKLNMPTRYRNVALS